MPGAGGVLDVGAVLVEEAGVDAVEGLIEECGCQGPPVAVGLLGIGWVLVAPLASDERLVGVDVVEPGGDVVWFDVPVGQALGHEHGHLDRAGAPLQVPVTPPGVVCAGLVQATGKVVLLVALDALVGLPG